jgi:predicted DsbA family dithiol-disulfide isomerase
MVHVIEYTDPACPFAFSFEPVRRRLLWTYGHGLDWQRRMIVLARSPDEYVRKGFTPERQAAALRDIQRRFGMPIDPRPRPRMNATEPACRAIVAARLRAGAAAEDRLLRELRIAAMAGDPIDEWPAIAGAARAAGLEPGELRRWMADPAVEQAVRRDERAARGPSERALALAHRLAPAGTGYRYTAPSLELEADGRRIDVPGLNPYETYEIAIANLAPELERRPAPRSAAEVLRWAGEPLATAEVAAVLGVERDDARTELAAVAEEQPAGPDGYWTLGRTARRVAA